MLWPMQKIWQRTFNMLLFYSYATWVCQCQPLCHLSFLFRWHSGNFVISLFSSIDFIVAKYMPCHAHFPENRYLIIYHDLYQSYFKAFLLHQQEKRAKGRLLLPQMGLNKVERMWRVWRTVGKALLSQTFVSCIYPCRENMDLKSDSFTRRNNSAQVLPWKKKRFQHQDTVIKHFLKQRSQSFWPGYNTPNRKFFGLSSPLPQWVSSRLHHDIINEHTFIFCIQTVESESEILIRELLISPIQKILLPKRLGNYETRQYFCFFQYLQAFLISEHSCKVKIFFIRG